MKPLLPIATDPMKAFHKSASEVSPSIDFDPTTSTLSIKGKAIPYELEQLFSDLIEWVEAYSENPAQHTKLEIDLQYLNGKSVRGLLALLHTMKEINDKGNEVSVDWNVPRGAEDMLDLTNEVQEKMNLDLHVHSN